MPQTMRVQHIMSHAQARVANIPRIQGGQITSLPATLPRIDPRIFLLLTSPFPGLKSLGSNLIPSGGVTAACAGAVSVVVVTLASSFGVSY